MDGLRRVGNSVPSAGTSAEQRYTADGNKQKFNSGLSAEAEAQCLNVADVTTFRLHGANRLC